MHAANFASILPLTTHPVWTLPFDAARQAYTEAVKAGLLPKSMIATSRFHRSVDNWEKLSLGPVARQV